MVPVGLLNDDCYTKGIWCIYPFRITHITEDGKKIGQVFYYHKINPVLSQHLVC